MVRCMDQFHVLVKKKRQVTIINPKIKLPFLVDRNLIKKFEMQLTKLHGKLTDIKIVEMIFIRGLQDFDKYDKLNSKLK